MEPAIRQYVWLWSEIDVNQPLPASCDDRGRCWIDGDNLYEFVSGRPQFIWSVLSAIPAKYHAAATKVDCTPFADGNRCLWSRHTKPQHQMAAFEIVCWDASATLLIGADEALAAVFRRAYPDAAELGWH